MKKKIHQIKVALLHRLDKNWQWLQLFIKQYWFRACLLAVVLYLTIRKDININVQLDTIPQISQNAVSPSLVAPVSYHKEKPKVKPSVSQPMNVSLLSQKAEKEKVEVAAVLVKEKKTPSTDPNLANTFSNITHEKDESAAKRAAKRKKQLTYVQRFTKVAQTEMDKFGIPASITLAQGLLESNVGASRLATQNNNHFGIKCFSKSCKKGHCSNFTDDSHKDFFRKYKNAWESYRAHSQLLSADRYAKLYKLGKKDYKGWAHGLKKAGYATDPTYAEKIIALIEDLKLHQHDE